MGTDPGTWRADRRRWLVVAGLLGLAALVRVSTMFYHDISGDDATVGLIAQHYLSGENFPAFFYRQTYMGALNGIHLAPALFLFGPSPLLVRLNAVAWSLLFPLGLYVLGRRVFDEATGRVALGLAAVPPFLLTYWSTVAEPHFETNLFGVLLLLLALAALRSPPGPRYLRALACFGLTAGLAWWTNFKAIEVVAPALLLFWLRDRWLPLGRGALLLAGGLLVGSLPAWLFYAARGDTSGRSHRIFETGLGLSLERFTDLWTIVLPTLLGTYYWKPGGILPRVALGLNVGIYVAAVLVGLGETIRRRQATPDAAWGRRLLLLLLVTPFAVLYVSAFVREFDHETARYILPAYIPLLLFAALLVARLGRRSRPAAALLLAFLLGFDLWTNAGFFWPLQPAERALRRRAIDARGAIVQALKAAPVQALYTDEMFTSLRWAFWLPGLPVSDLSTEIYVPHAIAADAAERVAILSVRPGDEVGEQLDMLGVGYRKTDFFGATLFQSIRARPVAYRMLPRRGWRVRDDPAEPPALADGDHGTAWPPAPPDDGVVGPVVVDLGDVYPVSRLVWWPSTDWETSVPVAAAVSLDGITWGAVGREPSPNRRPGYLAHGRPLFRPRDGWLELAFPPRPARYLRFAGDAGAGGPWAITELYAYADGPGPPPTAPDAGALVTRLRALGLTRLLADPAVSARVARLAGGTIRTRTANGADDSHGAASPAYLADRVLVRPTDALLVPAEEADDLRERLRGEVAFAEAPSGDQVLFHGLQTVWRWPCSPPARWRVRAGRVEIDLRESRAVTGVRFQHSPVRIDQVPIPAVALSEDGKRWEPARGLSRSREWVWAGRTLLALTGDTEDLTFAAAPARRLRLGLALPPDAPVRITALCVRSEPGR